MYTNHAFCSKCEHEYVTTLCTTTITAAYSNPSHAEYFSTTRIWIIFLGSRIRLCVSTNELSDLVDLWVKDWNFKELFRNPQCKYHCSNLNFQSNVHASHSESLILTFFDQSRVLFLFSCQTYIFLVTLASVIIVIFCHLVIVSQPVT